MTKIEAYLISMGALAYAVSQAQVGEGFDDEEVRGLKGAWEFLQTELSGVALSFGVVFEEVE